MYRTITTDKDMKNIKEILKNQELSNCFDERAYKFLSKKDLLCKYDKDMLLDNYEVKDICDMTQEEIIKERDYLEKELKRKNIDMFRYIGVDCNTDAVGKSTDFYIRNLIYHRHLRGIVNSKFRNKCDIVDRVCNRIISIEDIPQMSPIAYSSTIHKVKPFTIDMFGERVVCDMIYVATQPDGEFGTRTIMCYFVEK